MRRLLLPTSLLFTFACGVDHPAEPRADLPAVDAPDDEHAHIDHAEDELVAELTLDNGNVVRFFANADGSAGVLEEVKGTAAVTDDPERETWSVADVFWGLTDKRAEIPEALLRHHELMAADGDVPPTFMNERGWLLERLNNPTVSFASSSPCLNSTFNSNHCTSSTYPSGPACYFNTSGGIGWTTGSTRRFKAGFCLQEGQAHSNLHYEHLSEHPSIGCLSCRVSHVVWGGGINPVTYSATTYKSWWWIGPSGASRRKWVHTANGFSGAVYDWATKFYASTTCDAI